MSERHPARFLSLDIEYIGPVPTSDLNEVIEELSRDFGEIKVRRRMTNIGAGGPGLLEAAIFFTLGATSTGFLRELGKDAYHAAKDAFIRLYQRSKNREVLGATYRPLEIRATTQGGAELRFLFEERLDGQQFESALLAIDLVLESLQSAAGRAIQFEWNAAKTEWMKTQEIQLGSI